VERGKNSIALPAWEDENRIVEGEVGLMSFFYSEERERGEKRRCLQEEETMRILVVEDHPELGPDLKKGLEQCSYVVELVVHGEDALALGLAGSYDLIILDMLLPGLSGFEVYRHLRDQRRQTPILFLRALSEIDQRVAGLELGADDYLTRPFAFRELEASVRALVQQASTEKTTLLRFLDLTLDTRTHEARRGERQITLSSKEYALLEFLMHHPRQVLSRTTIAEQVWANDAVRLSAIIDVSIRSLRAKLCMQGEPDLIQTVRGLGYQLRGPEP
jgi:two-component system, OmpR family, response regulator MprA